MKHNKLLLTLATLLLCVGNVIAAAGDEIKDPANIVSGKSYYIKGVYTSSKVEYTCYFGPTESDAANTKISSAAVADIANAMPITFTQVTDGWTLQSPNGNYLRPHTSNGQSYWVEDEIVMSISAGTTKEGANKGIKIGPWNDGTSDWYIQANKTSAKIGAYKATQWDVTLIEAGSGSTKTLDNIAVKTAPTNITYTEGEKFNPAGLVITADYGTDGKEDIAYAGNESKFTFAPALTTALATTDAKVTITYGGKSVDQAITVNAATDKTIAEFIAAEGVPCYLTGIVSNIKNTTYGNYDLTDESGTIYIYGTLNPSLESKKFEELGVEEGDKIKVFANEYEYYSGTTHEAKNVVFVEIVEKGAVVTPKYAITIAGGIENGTVTASAEEAAEGATITLTATPNSGYELEAWLVKDADENAIEVTNNKFTMPAKAVTVSATFVVSTTFTSPNLGYETFGLTPEGTNTYAQPDVEENTTTFNGITLTTVKGDGNKVRFDKTLARIYKDNSLIIAAPAGKSIAKVVLTKGSTSASDWAGGETVIPAETYEAETSTWTGEAKKVTFTFGGTHRLASVTVKLVDYVDPTYAITCATGIENGEVSADLATAIEDQEVTLTATPNTGCEFVAWNVYKTDNAETKVTVTDNKFKMPAYAVTVSASFKVTPIIPTITVDGTLALEATEAEGTIAVNYTNMKEASVALFSDEACKTAFTGDWITASLNAGNNVAYTVEANEDADVRTVYIQITATSSTGDHATAVVEVNQQGSVPTYAITIADGIEHGNVSADVEYAHAGDVITLTATPASAEYIFEAWNVKGADETVVEVSAENKFTMPAQAVTVSATFKEKPATIVTLPHTGTFNGSAAEYTEGWTTTGTGISRTDCITIGKDENLTSPQMDLSGYKEVTIAFKGRKFGTLSGSQATVDASIAGTSLGTIGFTGSDAKASMGEIKFTPTEEMTAVKIVFTCTNATSAGSTHGAGFGSITITGKLKTTDPSIESEDEVAIAFDATTGEIAYEIENPVAETELTAASTTEWISNIVVTAEKVTFNVTANGGAARSGVITLTYGEISKDVTINQAKFVADYAVLPLSIAAGMSSSDLKNESGISGTFDGSDYSNDTHKVKFSKNTHYMQIKTNERPGVCTFSIRGCAGAGSSPFVLYGSVDGTNWTEVEQLTATFAAKDEVVVLTSTKNFGASDRYVKLAFAKATGDVNCGLGEFTIAQYVTPDPEWEEVREVTSGKYGTICLEKGVNEGDYVGATFYKVVELVGTKDAPEDIILEEVGELVAGNPYIFMANADKIEVIYNENTVSEAGEENGLVGSFTEELISTLTSSSCIYGIANNFILKAGSTAKVREHGAYLDLEKIGVNPPAQAPGKRRISMKGNDTEITTGINGVATSMDAHKLLIDGKLYIVREGKMFNANGQLVK